MTATNHTGYEVQVLKKTIGWRMEKNGYKTMKAARADMKKMPKDGFERRVYESLEGY